MLCIRKYFGSCVSCCLKSNTKKQTISTTHAQKSGKWIFYFNFVTNNGNQELQHTPLVAHKHSFIVLAIYHSSKYNNLQFAYVFGIIPVYMFPLFHFAVDPKPSQPTNQQSLCLCPLSRPTTAASSMAIETSESSLQL